MSYSKTILMGNLTRDPEVKVTPSGMSIAEFGIGINDKRKQGDEWVDDPSFFDVKAFGKSADIISRNYRKGDGILVDCKPKQERWDDKDTGQKRSKIVFLVEHIGFVPKRGSIDDAQGGSKPAPAGNTKRSAPPPAQQQDDAGDLDIPF